MKLDYLYSLQRFGMKLGLDVMRNLMDALGNPQDSLKIVHIAGTNGKGSTAAILERILRENGEKTGLYTSPHLIKFNERIKVDGVDITDDELEHYMDIVKQACESNDIQATFFEFTTAMMFVYFADKKVDYAVIETGLGGRLDATNICNPFLTLITTIAMDHSEHLGQTLEEIAGEKAGIIKRGVPCFTSDNKLAVLKVLKNNCEEKKSHLVNINDEGVRVLDSTPIRFLFGGIEYSSNLNGDFQVYNASLAIRAAKHLGFKIKGLDNIIWPGRLEIHDGLIIDSAHNEDAFIQLGKWLGDKEISLVVALSKEKDPASLTPIIRNAKHIYITKGDHKPLEPKSIQKVIGGTIQPDAKKAVLKAKKHGLPVLVTGSMYMIGKAYS